MRALCSLGLLLFLWGAPAQAAPQEHTIQTIAERMLKGDVDWAREAFRHEIECGFREYWAVPTEQRASESPLYDLVLVVGIARVLDVWQQSEAQLAQKGVAVPTAIQYKMSNDAERVQTELERIESSRQELRAQFSKQEKRRFDLERNYVLDTLILVARLQADPMRYATLIIGERMSKGDVDWAREAFRREIEHGLDRQASQSPLEDLMFLVKVVETLEVWQRIEAQLVRDQKEVSPIPLDEISRLVQRIHQVLDRIESAGKKTEFSIQDERAFDYYRERVRHGPAYILREGLNTAQLNLLAKLERQIPNEPFVPTPEIARLIHEVGATKRLDAASLLVRALAFGLSPIGQGESKSPFDLMPAAGALKSNFGSSALPLLMFSGVNTKEAWLQVRIALVIREIATPEEIKAARDAFSVEESKNPIAKQFAARLVEPEVNLSEDPVFSQFYELWKMIEELTEKKPSQDQE